MEMLIVVNGTQFVMRLNICLGALRSYIVTCPSVLCELILLEVTVVFGVSYFRSLPAMAL